MQQLLKFATVTTCLFLAACSTPITTSAAEQNAPQITIESLSSKAMQVDLTLKVRDVDGDSVDCTINWGDGKTESFPNCANVNPAGHTYSQEGLYLATVIATDETQRSSVQTLTVVASQLPVTTPITTVPTLPVDLNNISMMQSSAALDPNNTSHRVEVKIKAPDTRSTDVCRVNWGDGVNAPNPDPQRPHYQLVPCPSSETAVTHNYPRPGDYGVLFEVERSGVLASKTLGVTTRTTATDTTSKPKINMKQTSAAVNPANTANNVTVEIGVENLTAGAKCRINWGDGTGFKDVPCPAAATGFSYNYASPGDYAVLFEVTLANGDHYSKTLGVKVRRFEVTELEPDLILGYSRTCRTEFDTPYIYCKVQVYRGLISIPTVGATCTIHWGDGTATSSVPCSSNPIVSKEYGPLTSANGMRVITYRITVGGVTYERSITVYLGP